MFLDPTGSRWGKWDLHVHTPASINHQYPGQQEEAWRAFLSDLEALPDEYRVIGINDYLFLDGYERVLAERAQGRLPNIELVLPVIEFRLNVFGGTESHLSRVNYHVIFSETLEPQVIREQFLGALSHEFDLAPRLRGSAAASAWKGVLSRTALEQFGQAVINSVPSSEQDRYGKPLQEGFNNLVLSLEQIKEALESSSFLEGRFVTAVGKTEWADIKWKDGSIATKKHVINSVDCVFTASESASAYHRSQGELRNAEVNSRLLDCSDAHHLSKSNDKDRIGNCRTWIKADPTFSGLLQALEEFEQRVFVGDEPPQRKRVREHPSKYIERVKISRMPDSKIADPWFSTDLALNSGLVVVIGNKGSGKSALAEVMGLISDSSREQYFSFLTQARFRSPPQRLANNFQGEVVWRDGETKSRRLSDSVDPGEMSRVQHLPQQYLESLCNEVPVGDKTQFDAELEGIIFAHLSVADRLGASSLAELIQIQTGSINAELAEKRDALERVNAEIAKLEGSLRPTVRREYRARYRALRKEWLNLRRNAPARVPEPDQSDPKLQVIRQRLSDLNTAREHLATLLASKGDELAAVRKDQADLASFRSQLEGLHRRYESLRKDNKELLARLSVPDSVSTFTINTETLDSVRIKLAEEEASVADLLAGGENDERALREVVRWIDIESEEQRAKLSVPEEARENYLKQRAEWEKEAANLLGELSSNDPATVLGARQAFFRLDTLPARIESLRAQRRSIAGEIHQLLHRKALESAKLYQPLQKHMDGQSLPLDYQVSVDSSLVDTGFADSFLGEYINRNAAGSFYGVEESEKRLSELLRDTDFNDGKSVLDFLDQIDTQLRLDMRQSPPVSRVAAEQVRKGKSITDIYNWIYGLAYLSPRYGLLFGGKPIYQLSPGEKGTLLLVFFLLAEVDTRPLIIDQPEDNLDNNTVYRALVRCFQKAKKRRQVIIVTHNPNLAVVCDADQIIVARMDKTDTNFITYESGAIERPETVKALVDILEGTQPAFNNRSVKYTLHLLEH